MTILLVLCAMAIPSLMQTLNTVRNAKAVGDITSMETDIAAYEVAYGALPNTLNDIGRGNLLDPWGNPYQYLNFANTHGKSQMRKDRFLVPLNTDYDLYSKGADGKSSPPITAAVSRDDILRANDGAFVGLASQY